MQIFISALCLWLLTVPAYATSYYCATPRGTGYVSLGDTRSKVQSICGTPTQIRQQKTADVEKQEVQIWTFAPPWLAGTYAAQPRKSGIFGSREDIRNEVPSVSFTVSDNKVIAITGTPTGSAKDWRCPTGAIVHVGDPATRITSACGQATSISTIIKDIPAMPRLIVEWLYEMNQYSPPMILKFQNNQLISVE